jgi:hypothetical protein
MRVNFDISTGEQKLYVKYISIIYTVILLCVLVLFVLVLYLYKVS